MIRLSLVIYCHRCRLRHHFVQSQLLISINCSSFSPSSLSLSSSLPVELLLSSFRGPYFMLTLCHHPSLFRWPISLLFSCSLDSTRSLHPRRSLTHSHRTQKWTISSVTDAKLLNHCSPSTPLSPSPWSYQF